jgi:hypothetical protein
MTPPEEARAHAVARSPLELPAVRAKLTASEKAALYECVYRRAAELIGRRPEAAAPGENGGAE